MTNLSMNSIIAIALVSMFTAGPGAPSGRTGKDKGNSADEDRLPGSQIGLRESVRKSRLIVIAKDIDMGITDPDFRGKAYYNNVTFGVAKSLKGDAPPKVTSVRVKVLTSPPEDAETTPHKDQEYLFFLEGTAPDALKAIKVLRATEEQIRSTTDALKTVEGEPKEPKK
jgi:hypothetical protein